MLLYAFFNSDRQDISNAVLNERLLANKQQVDAAVRGESAACPATSAPAAKAEGPACPFGFSKATTATKAAQDDDTYWTPPDRFDSHPGGQTTLEAARVAAETCPAGAKLMFLSSHLGLDHARIRRMAKQRGEEIPDMDAPPVKTRPFVD